VQAFKVGQNVTLTDTSQQFNTVDTNFVLKTSFRPMNV